ncbi:phenylacetate--CoA ligase family protein [Streptomyces sp. NPDC050392]|uniref:phenylacetate--CoA ligase family protein n=1 Tax=Streptomyces sp. NPDC050392 TaxID=3155782 RepID=UPI003437C772
MTISTEAPAGVAPPIATDVYDEAFATRQAGGWTPQDLARWDAERVPRVLAHVRARSAFYAEHLAGADGVSATPAGLDRLPFTTKEMLRREMFRVLSGDVSEAAIYYETTGTTGASTPCPRGPLDVHTSNAHVEKAWRRLFGELFGERRPLVALMGPSELYAFGDVFGAVAQEIGSCHVKIWPESPRVGFAKALRLLRDLRAEVVVCSPALCVSLAKAALVHGYDLERDFAIKAFMVLGEICTPAFAANVASLWSGARVYPALYGSQEALCVATGCREQRLHHSRLNYLPEVLDPATGRSLGDSGTGELCLTMLIEGIKPLIRYRTGDLVRLGAESCGCGSPDPVIEVLGRTEDRIAVGTARVLPSELETAVLDGLSGCLGYQIVVDRQDGADRVTVRVDLTERPAAEREAAREGVAERIRGLCRVTSEAVVEDEIDPITSTGSFVSWKAARILDLRSAPDGAVRTARAVAHRYAVTR